MFYEGSNPSTPAMCGEQNRYRLKKARDFGLFFIFLEDF